MRASKREARAVRAVRALHDGFRLWALGFEVWGLRFGVQGLKSEVNGSWGLMLMVHG